MRFGEYRGQLPVEKVEVETFLGDRLEEGIRLGDLHYAQIAHIHPRYGSSRVTMDPEGAAEHIAAYYDFLAETGSLDIVERHFDPWVPETVCGLIVGDRVVDVGCCDGYYTVYYALSHPTKQFVGVDLSEMALGSARERARKYGVGNVVWLHENINYIQFPETDTFVLNSVMHELYGGNAAFPHLSAVDMFGESVRKGGMIVVSQEAWSPAEIALEGIRSTDEDLIRQGFRIHTTDSMQKPEQSCHIAAFEKIR